AAADQPKHEVLSPTHVLVVLQQVALNEEKFRIVGIDRTTGPATFQRAFQVAGATLALGKQGVEFADDGVLRMRTGETGVERGDGRGKVAEFVVYGAEVEQRERVVRLLDLLQFQQSQVAGQLPSAQSGIDVTHVMNGDLGPADVRGRLPEGGK